MESSNVVVGGVITTSPVIETTMNCVNVAAAVHENSPAIPPVLVSVAPANAKPFPGVIYHGEGWWMATTDETKVFFWN